MESKEHILVDIERNFTVDQGILWHEFHDPIALWMESFVSMTSSDTCFGILLIYGIKYQLSMENLLHASRSSYIFSKDYMQRVILTRQQLEWLNWKFFYT